MTTDSSLAELSTSMAPSEFLGYTEISLDSANIVALLLEGQPAESAGVGSTVDILLDRTPFYAESGGQTGDRGMLVTSGGAKLRVTDVQKAAGGKLFVHKCEIVTGSVACGDVVRCEVDLPLRRRARTNHTATHLLQVC